MARSAWGTSPARTEPPRHRQATTLTALTRLDNYRRLVPTPAQARRVRHKCHRTGESVPDVARRRSGTAMPAIAEVRAVLRGAYDEAVAW